MVLKRYSASIRVTLKYHYFKHYKSELLLLLPYETSKQFTTSYDTMHGMSCIVMHTEVNNVYTTIKPGQLMQEKITEFLSKNNTTRNCRVPWGTTMEYFPRISTPIYTYIYYITYTYTNNVFMILISPLEIYIKKLQRQGTPQTRYTVVT